MADWKITRLLWLTMLATAVIAALGALAFIESGIYNVGASKPHTKLTQWLTEQTMTHSIRSHARHIAAPANVSADQVMRGFCAYETRCVACHGAAAVARQRWAGGMEPQPPYLLDAPRKWRPRELFWIVRNGIKMTGMPSWRETLSDGEIWEVVGWVEASAQMPPQTYAAWRKAGVCGASAGEPLPH